MCRPAKPGECIIVAHRSLLTNDTTVDGLAGYAGFSRPVFGGRSEAEPGVAQTKADKRFVCRKPLFPFITVQNVGLKANS